MRILLEWNNYIERWIVKKPNGKNMFELPDCENFNVMFPNLNKEDKNFYIINAVKEEN